MMSTSDLSRQEQIQGLVEAIRSRVVPHVANRVNTLSPQDRSLVLTPALQQVSETDPASAQWFIRNLMAPEARDQLRQGIHRAAVEYLTASGFVEGRDFFRQEGELILSRAALPYTAADDDPFGQLLVAEFCQLQE